MRQYYKMLIQGHGFVLSHQRHSNAIVVKNWEYLISDMLYDKRISIWKRMESKDIDKAGCLHTNITPKLRELSRCEDAKD